MGDHVLLTGATGFLGGYLAGELLTRTSATIHCLVRGRSGGGGEARLLAGLRRVGTEADGRVRMVHGNLRKPRLGLSDREYARLAERIGAVYHCAASVNLAAHRDRLAPTNVDGTRAVLALAGHGGRRTPVHLVSTQGVFIAARAAGAAVIAEDTPVPSAYAGTIGYTQTKWEAEEAARAADVPVAVYRPGVVLGHSTTGHCSDNDFLARLLRAVVRVGAAPDCEGDITVSPVDYVARAIVDLSQRPDAPGRTFHTTHPEHLAFREVFDHARALGYPLRACSLEEWHGLLRDDIGSSDSFVMLALWKVVDHLLATRPEYRIPRIDSSATLARTGAAPPWPDRDFFGRTIDHLAGREVLPPLPLARA
ncbi:thioester reductase domain-containing protein [Nocardiopsis sp. CNT312]|uniref:thioester reductase domain-containing protein n=1 Tax=Nocardiopsis sp. CNT312 TaxID=1137268 RepID=UPI0004BC059A|nr:thioester reductase domain-containing protein [Nocardiopsis sp. CNT312]